MTIIDVTKDNASDFEGVLGVDLISDLSRNFYRGMASVDDDNVCNGAFVYELLGVDSRKENTSVIRHFTAESDEIKSQLMDKYENNIKEEYVKKSFYETAEADTAAFYESRGFSKEEGESSELAITVADLELLPFNRQARMPEYIKSLHDVSVLQYRTFLKKLLIKEIRGAVEDLAYLPQNWFDREASSCSVSDNKLDGIFLVRKTPSGELRPQLYTAFGPDYLKILGRMLIRTVNYVIENYPPYTKVVISRHSKEVMALTQRLLDGYKGTPCFTGNRDE